MNQALKINKKGIINLEKDITYIRQFSIFAKEFTDKFH